MLPERDLEWDGCFNVRDLGGLRTRDGRRTRPGAIIRADALDRLTERGWSSLEDHGVRTIVDLRNDDEVPVEPAVRSERIRLVHVPLDEVEDRVFWERVWAEKLDGSPLYFRMFLERKPHRCAAAIEAIAEAGPGGVVFHCGRGRDRTGLVGVLVLALSGVEADDIVSDYELSTERVRRLDAALGEHDQGEEIADILERKNVTPRGSILDLLHSVDLEERLRAGGLRDRHLDALRRRFVGPARLSR